MKGEKHRFILHSMALLFVCTTLEVTIRLIRWSGLLTCDRLLNDKQLSHGESACADRQLNQLAKWSLFRVSTTLYVYALEPDKQHCSVQYM